MSSNWFCGNLESKEQLKLNSSQKIAKELRNYTFIECGHSCTKAEMYTEPTPPPTARNERRPICMHTYGTRRCTYVPHTRAHACIKYLTFSCYTMKTILKIVNAVTNKFTKLHSHPPARPFLSSLPLQHNRKYCIDQNPMWCETRENNYIFFVFCHWIHL